MTDATNPPIQVLGEWADPIRKTVLTIVRDSTGWYIGSREQRPPGLPGNDVAWIPDPYVALGWVTYDDDGVPTWTGPSSDRHVTAMHASPFAVGDRVVFDNKRNDDLPVICIVTSARRASPSSSEWVYDISSGSQPFLSGVTGQWLMPIAESNPLEFEGDSDEYVTVRREDAVRYVDWYRGVTRTYDDIEVAMRLWAVLDRAPASDAKEEE